MPYQRGSNLYKVDPITHKTKAELILEFCKEPRTSREICEAVGIGWHQRLRESYLYPLIEKGELQYTSTSRLRSVKKYVTTGYEEKPVPTQSAILEFCQTPRTRKEIQEHFEFKRFLGTGVIARLIDEGKLIGNMPHSPTHNLQKFVAASSELPKTIREALLQFCTTPKTKEEICDELGLRWIVIYAEYISGYIKSGIMRFEIPERPKMKKQRYITVQEGVPDNFSKGIKAELLEFCTTPRTRKEICEKLELPWSLIHRDFIVKYVAEGLIRHECPDKPDKISQRFITVKNAQPPYGRDRQPQQPT